MTVEYQVRPGRAVRPLPDDDFENVACWEITRVTDGMGWHIAKYGDEATATRVAQVLQFYANKELS